MKNVAHHNNPQARLDELRTKNSPIVMASIEKCLNNVQSQLQKPNSPQTIKDLAIAAKISPSVPMDFPVPVPADCKITALQASKGKTIPFREIIALGNKLG